MTWFPLAGGDAGRSQQPLVRPSASARSRIGTYGPACAGRGRQEQNQDRDGAQPQLEFWGRPTGKVVIGLALATIEFLRRSPERAADVSATQT
jgi:hypothetical protein